MPCSRGPGTPGKSEWDQGIEDRGLRNTRQVFTLFSSPVTQRQSDSHAFVSRNFTLALRNALCDCLLFSFVFQLREENRIMEPHLVLKWGSHLYYEFGILFLKHNHE